MAERKRPSFDDETPSRKDDSPYLKLKMLGDGAYARVYEAKDRRGKSVAIKRSLLMKSDKGDFSVSLKEVDLFRRLNHPNLIPLVDVVRGNPFGRDLSPLESEYRDDNVCMVFPKAAYNAHTFSEEEKDISVRKKSLLGFLLGLRYLKRFGIIHRDIKPQNLLCFPGSYGTELKIGDLGLARTTTRRDPQSPQVVTIWYRSLELLLGNRHYDEGVDIWAAGCSLFEIIAARALFPGSSTAEMLGFLVDFFGERPSNEEFERIAGGQVFVSLQDTDRRKRRRQLRGKEMKLPSKRQIYLHNVMKLTKKQLDEFNDTPGHYLDFLDLLERMLEPDPKKRITIEGVLEHPFFQNSWARDVIDKDPPFVKVFPLIKFSPQKVREVGIEVIRRAVQTLKIKERKKNQLSFFALNLFDRVILEDQEYRKKKEGDDDMTKGHARVFAFVCVYITLKYLDPSRAPSVKQAQKQIEGIEGYSVRQLGDIEEYILRTLLDYRIYEETIYDLVDDSLDDSDIDKLFKVFCVVRKVEEEGMTTRDLVNVFLSELGLKKRKKYS